MAPAPAGVTGAIAADLATAEGASELIAQAPDADILANLTHVPGLVWVGAFLVVTIGALAWAVWRGQFESLEAEGERILHGD